MYGATAMSMSVMRALCSYADSKVQATASPSACWQARHGLLKQRTSDTPSHSGQHAAMRGGQRVRQGAGARVGQQRAAVRRRAQALGERGGVADAVAHALAAGVRAARGAAAHAPAVLQAAAAVGRGAAARVGPLCRVLGVLLDGGKSCNSACVIAVPQPGCRHTLQLSCRPGTLVACPTMP